AVGLVSLEEVLELLKEVPASTVVILTGRHAPKELMELADLISESREIKHPMKAGVKARKGIEY
ncbi:MAG: cob(I)yrinic acid a,c-diamide adenosyltransferase, partial [Candidatus Bathyarchaeia archaeon]